MLTRRTSIYTPQSFNSIENHSGLNTNRSMGPSASQNNNMQQQNGAFYYNNGFHTGSHTNFSQLAQRNLFENNSGYSPDNSNYGMYQQGQPYNNMSNTSAYYPNNLGNQYNPGYQQPMPQQPIPQQYQQNFSQMAQRNFVNTSNFNTSFDLGGQQPIINNNSMYDNPGIKRIPKQKPLSMDVTSSNTKLYNSGSQIFDNNINPYNPYANNPSPQSTFHNQYSQSVSASPSKFGQGMASAIQPQTLAHNNTNESIKSLNTEVNTIPVKIERRASVMAKEKKKEKKDESDNESEVDTGKEKKDKNLKRRMSKMNHLASLKNSLSDSKKKGRSKYLWHKLKIYFLTLFYPILWANDVKKKAKLRKEQSVKDFLDNKEPAEKLLSQKNSMIVVQGIERGFFGKKKLSPKTIETRMSTMIQPMVREFLEGLNNLSSEKLNTHLLKFQASLCSEFSFVPNKYLFGCEINRLNFNSFGAIKLVTVDQKKMILGVFMFIRILINKILLNYDVYLSTPKTTKNQYNTITFASIIYNLFSDYFKSKCKLIPHNMSHLAPEIKVQPKEIIFTGPHVEKLFDPKIHSDEIVVGLFSKLELKAALQGREAWMTEMTNLIDYWLINILSLINNQSSDFQQSQNLRAVRRISVMKAPEKKY